MTKANTGEWWRGPRGLFHIPVERDGTCEFWTISNLAEWHGERPHG